MTKVNISWRCCHPLITIVLFTAIFIFLSIIAESVKADESGIGSLASKVNKAEYETINVKDFGAVGDGVADDYLAIKQAFDYINTKGGNVTLLFPKGTYIIDRAYKAKGFGVKLTDPSVPWEGSKNEAIHHLILKDASNFKIIGNGSTIKVKGDYHKEADAKLAKIPYTFNYSILPFVFINCENFYMEGFDINGNAHLTTREKGVAEAYSYGLLLQNSENFTIENIRTHNWATDGLIVGHLGWVKNGQFINVTSEHNARQALSIDLAKDIVFKNCKFSYSGQVEGGKYGSHSLGAGVDIEPEGGATLENPTENITFEDCEFSHNIGPEIISTWNTAKNIYYKRCKIIRTASAISEGVVLGASGSFFEDCILDFSGKTGTLLPNYHNHYSSSSFIRSKFLNVRMISQKNHPLVMTQNDIEFRGSNPIKMSVMYIDNKLAQIRDNRIYIGKDYYQSNYDSMQILHFGEGTYKGNTYSTDKSDGEYFWTFYGKDSVLNNEKYLSKSFRMKNLIKD